MSPMVLSHATKPKNRLAIRRWGLIPRRPAEHNYDYLDDQPRGVYAFSDEFGAESSWSNWTAPYFCDEWHLMYCGPLLQDPLVGNAVVIQDRIPPECLTLARKAGFLTQLDKPSGMCFDANYAT